MPSISNNYVLQINKGFALRFFFIVQSTFYKVDTLKVFAGGHALTPSFENTRITTNCWTIIHGKTLELTKKDTPHPKTKEKPQWDGRRGAITKSNPVTAGWVTHKLENTYTTEVHPLEWRFWAPRQASHLGVRQREEEVLENQTLKASRIWLQDFDRTGRNRDSTLGGHTQSSVCTGTLGRLHCWVASDQTTNREGTQPHPSADKH